MLRDLVVFVVAVVALLVVVGVLTSWAVTVLQVAAVPDEAWERARDDRRTWLLVVLLGGPVGALVFWLTTWPQLADHDGGLPVLPVGVTSPLAGKRGGTRPEPGSRGTGAGSGEFGNTDALLDETRRPADSQVRTTAKKAPARKAPATKSPAKAPARKPAATKGTAKAVSGETTDTATSSGGAGPTS